MLVFLRIQALLLAGLLVLTLPARAADGPFRYQEGQHGKGELKYIQGIPVLVVAGAPKEMGEQIGTLTRDGTAGLLGYFRKLLKEVNLEAALPWLTLTSKGLASRFPADYLTEAAAGAKVAGIDYDLIITANLLWDMKKLGCSTLFVAGARSATGGPLMGRNFDFQTLGVLGQYSLVIVYRPEGKHAFAAVAFPGLIGPVSAMNDAGLSLAVLDVHAAADGSQAFDFTGTPLLAMLRQIMETCTTVAEAEKLLKETRRTTRINLAVCDRSGGAVFELTPKSVQRRQPDEGLCCCTNHFRTKGLAVDTECPRFTELEKSKALPKLGLAEVAKRMDAANQGENTLQTMIFEPAALKLHIALGKGPTSAKPLQPLDLGPLFRGGKP